MSYDYVGLSFEEAFSEPAMRIVLEADELYRLQKCEMIGAEGVRY